MKKMLIVFPHNFLVGGTGTNERVTKLAYLFKEMGFCIDLFAFSNRIEKFEKYELEDRKKVIDNIYDYDYKKINGKNIAWEYLIEGKRLLKREYLDCWTNKAMYRMFQKIVNENQYDVVVTFYSNYAKLFQNLKPNIKKVYFMEDCGFFQRYYRMGNIFKQFVSIGKVLDYEVQLIRCFDEIFCISYDEKLMYEKFLETKIHFLPHLIEQKDKSEAEKKWDVLFVGANNRYNIEGLEWFVENVYQHLDKDIKVLLVGRSTDMIDCSKMTGITKISFADDLDEIYNQTKVVICPMLHGTGMKIKVVEAMSRGIPVVCNERGVDGLPDKYSCGCLVSDNPKEFAGYVNRLIQDKEFYTEKSNQINDYFKNVFYEDKYRYEIEKAMS